MAARSTETFRSLHENQHDLIARTIISGLNQVIEENHRMLEGLADPRLVALSQGQIALARSIIKCVTETPQRGRDKEKNK